MKSLSLSVLWLLACSAVTSWGQQHGDHAGGSTSSKVEPPTIFLDKSPRIVEYQLKRLDNQRLLLVDRKADDPKYIPVYTAILTRVGMSPQYRQEALEALAELQDSGPVEVLLEAIGSLDPDDNEQRRTARQLTALALESPVKTLREQAEGLAEATASDSSLVRQAAFAMLMSADQLDSALQLAQRDQQSTLDWLASVQLVPDAETRSSVREPVVGLLKQSDQSDIRKAAVAALAHIPGDQQQTFELVATLVGNPQLRTAAVRTLLTIPAEQRDRSASAEAVEELVNYAEQTAAENRTSDAFVDAMQLADQLLARIPADDARDFRSRLNEVSVRVIRIRTVEEEMRYDRAYFAVEAGRPVQIVLENHDLMPHNLVITVPGALKEVAQLGLQVGPDGGWQGLPYVPESEQVLHATDMVAADQQTRLTFDAPSEPGEYPYVCTFPQHWYRMYGVMVVVKDLDAWARNPVEPANPLGNNRSFVQSWKVDDLKHELADGMRGRSPEIGKKLFEEASCAGCHKVNGVGGAIGPELTDVFSRWKGDAVGVLREILDPSHKVDAKYAMQRILTFDGRTITGILVAENDDEVQLMASAETQQPIVIPQDEIDAMVPSSVSMMPKALLDQYTQDEIFEIMSYLRSVDPKQ